MCSTFEVRPASEFGKVEVQKRQWKGDGGCSSSSSSEPSLSSLLTGGSLMSFGFSKWLLNASEGIGGKEAIRLLMLYTLS